MPYKSEKILLGKYDRRKKLTDKQRKEIKEKYTAGGCSHRSLAREYGVSHKLIFYILNPDKEVKDREDYKQRKADGRYKPTKEEWAATVREHRHYKQRLYLEGKIGGKK